MKTPQVRALRSVCAIAQRTIRRPSGAANRRGQIVLGLKLLVVTHLAVAAQAQLISSTWFGGSGNWSVAANWNPSDYYPNNGDGRTFDVSVGSGTATLSEAIAIQKLSLSDGAIGGNYDLTANDLFSWTGGELSGSGTLTANGGMTWSGSSSRYLNARTLKNANAGTVTYSGGYVQLSYGATLRNEVGGTIDLTSDTGFQHGSSGANLNNAGTFRKSGGSGESYVNNGIAFNNTGAVEVNSGTLALHGGGSSSGTFTVAAGKTPALWRGHLQPQ